MLLKDLPINGRLYLGYCGDTDFRWAKVSDDNDFISVRPVSFQQFDENEYTNTSRDRRRFGNNFFPHSNLLQWLNASDPDWFTPQHQYDARPFMSSQGFLCCLSPEERRLLVPREITVAVPLGSKKQFGKMYTMECKVCLPSAAECGYSDSDEGFALEGEALPGLVDLIRYERAFKPVTRTGCRDGGHVVLCFSNEEWRSRIASDRFNVYPMFRLAPDTVISDEVDEEGYHFISTPNKDEEFFRLLVS